MSLESTSRAVLAGVIVALAPLAAVSCTRSTRPGPTVVLVSANAEWRALLPLFPDARREATPFGEWLEAPVGATAAPVIFVHGGWGKISAAASTQYAIDRWRPALLVNLGTCGGFEGRARAGDVVLVERTVVYDIIERMGDPREAIAEYATTLDLSWVGSVAPSTVRRGTLASADQDLDPAALEKLAGEHGAIAGDWESGAIAFTAHKNGTRLVILRAVSDVVGASGSVAYGNEQAFVDASRRIMRELVGVLPAWIERSRSAPP
jgi:adenosylhomocysteine nucleosidase